MLPDALWGRALRWSDAKGLRGEAFDLLPDEGGEPVLRLEVVEAAERHSAPHMVQFALLLRGPAAPLLEQRAHRLRHARLGEFAILVTPVARTAASIDYEACFSHAP